MGALRRKKLKVLNQMASLHKLAQEILKLISKVREVSDISETIKEVARFVRNLRGDQ